MTLKNGDYPNYIKKAIYFHNTFDFKKVIVSKFSKENLYIWRSRFNSIILKKNDILKHKEESEFLRIGAIQDALKPMFRSGLDTTIRAIVRDKRQKDFVNSLLGIIKPNLARKLC